MYLCLHRIIRKMLTIGWIPRENVWLWQIWFTGLQIAQVVPDGTALCTNGCSCVDTLQHRTIGRLIDPLCDDSRDQPRIGNDRFAIIPIHGSYTQIFQFFSDPVLFRSWSPFCMIYPFRSPSFCGSSASAIIVRLSTDNFTEQNSLMWQPPMGVPSAVNRYCSRFEIVCAFPINICCPGGAVDSYCFISFPINYQPSRWKHVQKEN